MPLSFLRSISPPHSVSIDWNIESPSIIFHGTPDESTGAIFTGQVVLSISDDSKIIRAFSASLGLSVQYTVSGRKDCADYGNRYKELHRWDFLTEPSTFERGVYSYPFSVLLDGRLPASSDTKSIKIGYEFRAQALVGHTSDTSPPTLVNLRKVMLVKRSIPKPELPHSSVQSFPPTGLNANVRYDKVIHPTGPNMFSFKLSGPIVQDDKNKSVHFWVLNMLAWRLEETRKLSASSCQHSASSQTEVSLIEEKEMYKGWKSAYSGANASFEMEFDYSPSQCKSRLRTPKYAFDTKTDDGIEITHVLIIRLSVSRESAPIGKTHLRTSSGTRYGLCLRYDVVCTDYCEKNVSWDKEIPPMYEDISSKPPHYDALE